MNNRIKKLAEQAGFMLWQDEAWNPGDVVDWSARYDKELEKFAELIVRECIDICNPIVEDIVERDTWTPLGAVEEVQIRIAEKFGVEE